MVSAYSSNNPEAKVVKKNMMFLDCSNVRTVLCWSKNHKVTEVVVFCLLVVGRRILCWLIRKGEGSQDGRSAMLCEFEEAYYYRELPNIWTHFDGDPNFYFTFIEAIRTWIKNPFSTLGKSGGEADPRYQSREGVQQLCRWRQKIQITRKIQRQKRYQSTTTFLKQTGFLDFKSDCQNCKSSNVAKNLNGDNLLSKFYCILWRKAVEAGIRVYIPMKESFDRVSFNQVSLWILC